MERKKAIKKRAHTHEINVLLVIKQVTRVSGVPGGVGMTWHKLYHPYFGFILFLIGYVPLFSCKVFIVEFHKKS